MSEKPSNRWKRLDPFAQRFYDMTGALQKMSTPDLRKLRASIERAGRTNCGWATYAAAQFLRGEVRSVLLIRARTNRSKAAKRKSKA